MGGKLKENEPEGGVDSPERVAAMNPGAVNEAKVYTGRVYHHTYLTDTVEHVGLPKTVLVEVGKWTDEDEERNPEHCLSTYNSAVLLGYKKSIHWVPAGEDDSGDRKWLISAGRNDNGELVSFSIERAEKIAHAINEVLDLAKFHQAVLSRPEQQIRYAITHDGITHPA